MSKHIFRTIPLMAGLGAAGFGAGVPAPRAILLAVTSHDQLGATGQPTGAFLSEITHAYYVFLKSGFRVDFVSPHGGRVPLYGLEEQDAENQAFLADPEAQSHLQGSLKAAEVAPENYAAIYFAGGHGVMWDFPEDPGLARLARSIYEQGGLVGAVCHGPAALINLRLSDGTYLLQGRQVTGFSNEEEAFVKLTGTVPFLLEDRLAARAAGYSKAPLFQAHVVVSGRLVTGQNPASARGVAAAMVKGLGQ